MLKINVGVGVGVIHYSSQSTHCFSSMDWRDAISLAVELKYQQPSARIADLTLKCKTASAGVQVTNVFVFVCMCV